MKHYVLNDDIRNLLMQTILKEEEKPRERPDPEGKRYASELAKGAEKAGVKVNIKAYQQARAAAVAKANRPPKPKPKPPEPSSTDTPPKRIPDSGQHTTDEKLMAQRRRDNQEAAKKAEEAEAAGIKDPTPSRLIDKGKGREAAEAVTAEYKAYEDRERAARARDAERAAKRNK